jgi:Ni/Co efflux regulator RcnB
MLKTLAAALIATSLVAGPVLAAQGTTGAAGETAPAPKLHKKHHVRHHVPHHVKHVRHHMKHAVKHTKHHHMAKVAKTSKPSKADR